MTASTFHIHGYGQPGFPEELMLRHENQALKNHAMTIRQLQERGGLRAEEALAIMEDRMWDMREDTNALDALRALHRNFEQGTADEQTLAEGPTPDNPPPPEVAQAPVSTTSAVQAEQPVQQQPQAEQPQQQPAPVVTSTAPSPPPVESTSSPAEQPASAT